MSGTGFRISRIRTEGNNHKLLYREMPVAQFEQRVDKLKQIAGKTNHLILNYNVFIDSSLSLDEAVLPAIDFYRSLMKKSFRGFTQALKDAGQYYGTIFEGREYKPEIKGFNSTDLPGELPPDIKKLVQEIKNSKLTGIILDNPEGISILMDWFSLRKSRNDKPSYHTNIRVDGFDTNISEELAKLVLAVGNIQFPRSQRHALSQNLANLLSNYQIVRS